MSTYKQRLGWQLAEKKLSGKYWINKTQVNETNAALFNNFYDAKESGYYTSGFCERNKTPVTDKEFSDITHYVYWGNCYSDVLIFDSEGKRRKPCVPVFFRDLHPIPSNPK